MQPFLKLVADSLYGKFGNDLSRVIVVCPNKRAKLFLNAYLAEACSHPEPTPVWTPQYLTISELFHSLSQLELADPIECICRIHQIYTRLCLPADDHSVPTPDTSTSLDAFYGWGEKILSDFNDIDKNLTNPDALFRNLADLKALDRTDYIDADMEQALKAFFQNFSLQNHSILRERFLRLWNTLGPIYRQLNKELEKEGMAYEGALHRRVLEGLLQGNISLQAHSDTFAIVGFNVLNKVEEQMFQYLQAHCHTLFYWDYDLYYTEENPSVEAGTFMVHNLKKFPNVLEETHFRNFMHIRHMEFISAPTENAQARLATQWIRERLAAGVKEHDMAIVLCNESMLQPLLFSLPDEVKSVNVTKGFPLQQTPAYTFVEKSFDNAAAHKALTALQFLTHLGTRIANEARQHPVPESPTAKDMHQVLCAEAYFQAYTIVERFRKLAAGGLLDISLATLRKLMRQVMRTETIPFHGEPAEGLQVMGVLETRNLDFGHILMLSVNEKLIPKTNGDDSIVPFHLKESFGLTTLRHKTAVQAYHFYRLLQRATSITATFNASTEGMVRGEKSRFLTQLEMESGLPIVHRQIVNQAPAPGKPLGKIRKPDRLPERIARLSATSINTYLRCQKMFYYRYVLHLKEPPKDPDVIEPNTFGTIFHRSAELIYQCRDDEAERTITQEELLFLLSKEGEVRLDAVVRQAFADAGVNFHTLVAAVVKTYLLQLLRLDAAYAPFHVVGTEYEINVPMVISANGKSISIPFKGEIDRLDRLEIEGRETLRIIDYKTGGKVENEVSDFEDLFDPGPKGRHYVLQTFLYAQALRHQFPQYPLAPSLIFIHKAATGKHSPHLVIHKEPVYDFSVYAEAFQERMDQVLTEMFDVTLPFSPTNHEDFCRTCPFVQLCKTTPDHDETENQKGCLQSGTGNQ